MSEERAEPGCTSSLTGAGSLFHHETWQERCTWPEFPPDESRSARQKRFQQKPWWDTRNTDIKFLTRYEFGDNSWPWGYFIYQRWFDSAVRSLKYEGEAGQLIAEGFRNVIIEDKDTLDGAGVETILLRHRNWVD
ncbi:hypothetical protein BJX65DRAFT_312260 [Aspergillus insuetus]